MPLIGHRLSFKRFVHGHFVNHRGQPFHIATSASHKQPQHTFSAIRPPPSSSSSDIDRGAKARAFADIITSTKFAVLSSTSDNPFVNLSIESFLLQKSRPDSVILFSYVNRPCVVIGRNQNPWLEVNLARINTPTSLYRWMSHNDTKRLDYIDVVDLVRRRTGGGTVFHDGGNVNYCVLCPKDEFTRNKYAEMVVRALRSFSPRVRVNERHDIVLDQREKPRVIGDIAPNDTHRTYYEDAEKPPLKISGSAFKMTRLRAMHHGTCLLHSPNLPIISDFLRSPAAPYIKALGVDSVRSPVGNVREASRGTAIEDFREAVAKEFCDLNGIKLETMASRDQNSTVNSRIHHVVKLPSHQGDLAFGLVDECLIELPDIKKGIDEMQSYDWIYGQTPRFSFSSHPTNDDPRKRPEPAMETIMKPQISLSVKQSIVESAHIAWPEYKKASLASETIREEQRSLVGTKLHEIKQISPLLSVSESLSKMVPQAEKARQELGKWLAKMLLISGDV